MMRGDPPHGLPAAASHIDLRTRVLAFAMLFSAFVVAIALLGAASLRDSALASAEQRARDYAHILSAHLERVLAAVDARLSQIALQAPTLGGPRGADSDWRPILDASQSGSPTIGSISVTDEQGVIRHSTLDRLVGADRRDRFINRMLADPSAPELVSDAPMRTPSGRLILPFGRRLVNARGEIEGAIVASFVPESLREFYRAVDTQGGTLRILHQTGALVLSEPEVEAQIVDENDPVLVAYRAGARHGTHRGRLPGAAARTLTGFSGVGGTGLVVSVSLGQQQALAAWRSDMLTMGAISAAALAAFWLAVALFLRQLKAREAAEQALLQQQQRFAAAQRLEALGQLTGGVAHDFNNLLTVIINSADALVTRVAEEGRPRVDAIIRAAENGAALIQQLLAYSRRQALSFESVDVNEIVRGMEDMIRRTLGPRVETQFVLAPQIWRAFADKSQIESALLNLAINARDAMPGGGTLTVETHNAHLDETYLAHEPDVAPGEYVALAVTDSGMGMSPEVIERATEPFFTTKEAGKGTGLGLSMIYGFAKQSKGHLKIYSELGHGTTVRLYLPRDVGYHPIIAPAPSSAEGQGGSETILVVEDDAQVRQLAITTLRERGYTVLEAANGAEAVAVLDSDQPLDLVLTDIVMPGAMTGRDVGEYAVKARPNVKLLFTSGYADASVMRNGLVQAGARFLSKPYRGRELASVIRALLDG